MNIGNVSVLTNKNARMPCKTLYIFLSLLPKEVLVVRVKNEEKGTKTMDVKSFRGYAIISCIVILILSLSLTVFTAFAADEGKEYYFDSNAAANGTGTMAKPFNSLASIEGLELTPGSKIYLKKGSVFKEQLRLVGINGTEDAPITVTSYGDSNAIPRIDGCDTIGEGVVYIENCNWITVSDLEIFDTATYLAERRGVFVYGSSDGKGVETFSGITLERLFVHNIRSINSANGSEGSKQNGGIVAWCDGNARFDSLTVTDCYIKDIDGVGISVSGGADISPYSNEFAASAHTNLEISHNNLSYIGENAVFVGNLMGGVIEHNVASNTANSTPNGTFATSYVYGTVVQHNEGYLNNSSTAGNGATLGGSMLYAGPESRETVWQYNYSHDNSFGLFANSGAAEQDEITVRYNLSVNDRGENGIILLDCASSELKIYNNTIVCGEGLPVILKAYNNGGKIELYNNLIYNSSVLATVSLPNNINATISNNIVYNTNGASIEGMDYFMSVNTNGSYDDPQFAGEIGANVRERTGRETAIAFQVKAGSPALTLGKETVGVESDYFGNAYSESVGFYCGKGNDDASIDYALNADNYREYQYHDIEIVRDIPFATVTTYRGGSKTLNLDIYSANDCTDRNRPLVVMIHGGGFTTSSAKEQSYAIKISKLLAQKGYVVASIDYRTRESSDMQDPKDKAAALDDATEDANTAINWLRSQSSVYGFNPDYIFVAGGSAGGATAVCYAFAEDSRGFNKSGIVAVADLWGGPRDIFDDHYDSDFSQDDNFPTIFIHGTGDTTMEYTHSLTTYQKMAEKGITASWNPISGAEHSLIGTDDTYEMTTGLISEFFADRLAEKIAADGGYTQPPALEEREESKPQLPVSTKDRIYPNADTYVYSNSAGKYANYSTDASLFVYDSSNTSYLRSSILRFDTEENTVGSYLNKTVLHFTVTSITGISADKPQQLEVYALADNYWFADELTWVNTPDYTNKVYLGTIQVTGKGEYTLDITNYVYNIQQSGGRTVTILLEANEAPASAKRIEIASYESGKNVPYLECSYSESLPTVHKLTVQTNGNGSADISETTVVDGSSLIVNLTPAAGYIASRISVDTAALGVNVELSNNQAIVSGVVADTVLSVYFTADDSVVVAKDSTTVQYGSASSAVVNTTDSSDPTNVNPLYLCTKGAVSGGNNNTNRVIWISFDISNYDFTNEKVTFEIYCYKNVEFSGNTMPVDVYATTFADWSSDSFAWNDQPFADGLRYGSSIYETSYGAKKIGSFTVNGASKWYTVDVTDYVQALRVSGFTEFSLVLVDRDYNKTSPIARFVSTHATTTIDGVSLAPRLTTEEKGASSGTAERIDLDVNVSGEANGTVSGYNDVVKNGATVLRVSPKEGYGAIVTVDGVDRKIYDGKVCIFGADENTDISVTFAKEYTVSIDCGEHTAVEAEMLTVCKGESVTIVFATDAGYKPIVKINGQMQTLVGNTLTLTVIQNISITVEGVKIIQ